MNITDVSSAYIERLYSSPSNDYTPNDFVISNNYALDFNTQQKQI